MMMKFVLSCPMEFTSESIQREQDGFTFMVSANLLLLEKSPEANYGHDDCCSMGEAVSAVKWDGGQALCRRAKTSESHLGKARS